MSSLVQKIQITRNFCQFADESKQPFVPLLKEAIAFGNEFTKPCSMQTFDTLFSDFTSQLNSFECIVGDLRMKVQTILQRSSDQQDVPSEISVVSNHLFDGLELSKHLKSLVSKQGIEEGFLFFSYCIGLLCRFMSLVLLQNQFGPYESIAFIKVLTDVFNVMKNDKISFRSYSNFLHTYAT